MKLFSTGDLVVARQPCHLVNDRGFQVVVPDSLGIVVSVTDEVINQVIWILTNRKVLGCVYISTYGPWHVATREETTDDG